MKKILLLLLLAVSIAYSQTPASPTTFVNVKVTGMLQGTKNDSLVMWRGSDKIQRWFKVSDLAAIISAGLPSDKWRNEGANGLIPTDISRGIIYSYSAFSIGDASGGMDINTFGDKFIFTNRTLSKTLFHMGLNDFRFYNPAGKYAKFSAEELTSDATLKVRGSGPSTRYLVTEDRFPALLTASEDVIKEFNYSYSGPTSAVIDSINALPTYHVDYNQNVWFFGVDKTAVNTGYPPKLIKYKMVYNNNGGTGDFGSGGYQVGYGDIQYISTGQISAVDAFAIPSTERIYLNDLGYDPDTTDITTFINGYGPGFNFHDVQDNLTILYFSYSDGSHEYYYFYGDAGTYGSGEKQIDTDGYIYNISTTPPLSSVKNIGIGYWSNNYPQASSPNGEDYSIYIPTPATPPLETLNEGNGNGTVIRGRNAANYGNLGQYAFDVSTNLSASSTAGATGQYSIAMSQASEASGQWSFAANQAAKAQGLGSVSLGRACLTTGTDSFSAGYSNTASGSQAIALGGGVTASGTGSVALGTSPTASGPYTFATGYFASATGDNSIAIGRSTSAPSAGEVSIGAFPTTYTPANNVTDRAFNVGAGINDTTGRKDVLTVKKNGNATLPSSSAAGQASEGSKAILTKEYGDALYQPVLSSGVNIKTVGGNSLLGSGDVTEVQNSLAASTVLAPSASAVNTGLSGKVSFNGDSLGANMVIGTNDANNVQIRRNGSTILTVAAGGITLQDGQTMSNASTVTRGTYSVGTISLPPTVTRNSADAVAAFAINNNNASNTGPVVIFQSGGSSVGQVSKAGLYTGSGYAATSSPSALNYWATDGTARTFRADVLATPAAGVDLTTMALPSSSSTILQFLGYLNAYRIRSLSVTAVSAAYTATSYDRTILASGASAYNVTLPVAGGPAPFDYIVKNTGTGIKTVLPGSGTIDGLSSWPLEEGSSIQVQTDGANYHVTAVYKKDSTTNATTSALSSATLNSTYPNVPVGYRVICKDITGAPTQYIKLAESGSSDVWGSAILTIVP